MRRLLWFLALIAMLPACSGDSTSGSPATSGAAAVSPNPSESEVPMGPSPIDGQYRTTITVADGVEAGLTPRQAGKIDGKVETTFSLGVVRQFIVSGVSADGFMGTFQVQGSNVILTDNDGFSLTLGYRLKGEELSFTIVDDPAPPVGVAYDTALWTSHPWVG